MAVIGDDVQKCTGSLQLSAGQPCGYEAAIHAVRDLFADQYSDGVLLIDAKNAFNCLNRNVALGNVRVLCPALGTIVINTYRSSVALYVGGEQLLSTEGTTQGDPLAMAIYAVAITPLIRRVKQEQTRQIWFADDTGGSRRLRSMRMGWDCLSKYGPMYGYFVNSGKTWLVVKEDRFDETQNVFQGTEKNDTHCKAKKQNTP